MSEPIKRLREWVHPEKLDWYWLSENPEAIHLIREALEQNLDKIYWDRLSLNPKAIYILEKNLDKINWKYLSSNPAAIHILEQNPDKIDWQRLSCNPVAIHLISKALEQKPDKIDWSQLSRNPAIFIYDYAKITEYMESTGIKDELIAYYYRPENIHKFVERGDLLDDFNSRWS